MVEEKIVVAMGDFGIPARILYKRLGSMVTYCSDNPVAPGMISPKIMSGVFHADKVNTNTSIYGVIGNPVYHSVSPLIHNKGFNMIHFNAVYVPFLVDDTKQFFRLAELLHICGFSVTAPFKYDVIPFLGNTTREVRNVSACNTVVREHGFWKGLNTDFFAIENLLDSTIKKSGVKTALVIGAGGAARTIVYALTYRNIKVIILNRTEKTADKLARLTGNVCDKLENAEKYSFKADVIIQATSCSNNPVPELKFSGKETVIDLVYDPLRTEFLRKAEKASCRTITGLDFVFAQGKLQFEVFTGYHYPRDVMPSGQIFSVVE